MGVLFSRIQAIASKYVTAMIQKQIENSITKVGQGINDSLFGEKIKIANIPFSNNIKKQYPNAEELPGIRSLNKFQRERQERKNKRKRERRAEIIERKNLVEVAGNEILRSANDQIDSLVASSFSLANNIANAALAQITDATELAVGIFESYKKLFSDLGTHGDKVVENSKDLVKTMIAAAPAILGSCAVGPTVTPGALPQYIFAVKSKSDALGTELSKFKSALNELKGTIKSLGDFTYEVSGETVTPEIILDTLEIVDTMTIVPQSLILATGGMISILDVELEEIASDALELLVGDLAAPIMALATNKATLCSNWTYKFADPKHPTLEELEFADESNFLNYTWETCSKFTPIEYSMVKDDNGIPMKDNEGNFIYETDKNGNRIPKYSLDKFGNKVFAECENCSKYKRNEDRVEKMEGGKE